MSDGSSEDGTPPVPRKVTPSPTPSFPDSADDDDDAFSLEYFDAVTKAMKTTHKSYLHRHGSDEESSDSSSFFVSPTRQSRSNANGTNVARGDSDDEPVASTSRAFSSVSRRSKSNSSDSSEGSVSPNRRTKKSKALKNKSQPCLKRSAVNDENEISDRYIYFEKPTLKISFDRKDFNDPSAVLNLQTIDKTLIPENKQMVRQLYKSTRKKFKVVIAERKKVSTELDRVKKSLKVYTEFVTSLSAVVKMLDMEYRFIATDVLNIDILSNAPQEAHECDKILKYLTRPKFGKKLLKKLNVYLDFIDGMIKTVLTEQTSMFLDILPLFRGFAENDFQFLVSKVPHFFEEFSGKPIEEVLATPKPSGRELGELFLIQIKRLRSKYKKNLNASHLEPHDVGKNLPILWDRAQELAKSFVNHPDEKQLEEVLHRRSVESNASEESDEHRASRGIQENPYLIELGVKADDSVVNEQFCKWFHSFHRKWELPPVPENDPIRMKLLKRLKLGRKAIEKVDYAVIELAKRRRLLLRMQQVERDLKENVRRSNLEVKSIFKDMPGTLMLKEEVDTWNKQVDYMSEKWNRIREFNSEMKKEMDELKDEIAKQTASLPTDPEMLVESEVPEMIQSQSELTKLVNDLKIINREIKTTEVYAETVNEIKSALKAHIIAEEAEFIASLQTLADSEETKLDELRQKVAEDRAELESFKLSPEPFKEIEAIFDDLDNEDLRCQALNAAFDEETEELEKNIRETEISLNNLTKDFDTHIRIEINFAPVKNLPLMDTELDDHDVSLIFVTSKHNAVADFHKNSAQLGEKEFGELIVKETTRNDSEALEAIRLKQVLLYLYHATPEEKRIFYTQEAERRVRFSRHSHERAREMNSIMQSVFVAHTQGDERLADYYGTILDGGTRITEHTKAQEEQNSRFLEFLLRDVTQIKKARENQEELQLQHDEIQTELKDLIATIGSDPFKPSESTDLTTDKSEINLMESVEEELELNSMITDISELTSLIEIEKKRFADIDEIAQSSEHDVRKRNKKMERIQGALTDAEKHLKSVKGSAGPVKKGPQATEDDTKRLQALLRCSNCMQRDKSAIITKCNHLFCEECILNLVKARNRKCPKCKEGFGNTDFRVIDLREPELNSSDNDSS